MNTKQIIFTSPCVAELLDRQPREMTDDDVLVETAVSSLSSGTERAIVSGDPNVSIYSTDPVAHFPRESGYSSAGTVIAVGKNVKKVAVGDRVVVSWGAHAKHQVLREDWNITKISDDRISFSEAALFHIGTFPLAAIRKCHLEIGESAIVMGLGVLGMMAVQLLRAAGAVPIIAADPVAKKREEALRFGADYALDPLAPDFVDTVKKITNGGANVAIEVTGFGSALDGVLDCMAPFGRVALLGCTRDRNFTIDYYRKVHGPGIALIGAHTNARPARESSAGLWTTFDYVTALIRLTAAGRIDLGAMVSETHIPTDCGEVYARLCREKSFPLVQFDWSTIK